MWTHIFSSEANYSIFCFNLHYTSFLLNMIEDITKDATITVLQTVNIIVSCSEEVFGVSEIVFPTIVYFWISNISEMPKLLMTWFIPV